MIKEESTLGKVIDSTESEFKDYCGDKDLGYLENLKILLVQTFDQVVASKNACLSQGHKEQLPALYEVLFRIENKIVLINKIKVERLGS